MEVIPYVEDVIGKVGRFHRPTVLVIGSVHLIGAFYQVFGIDASIDTRLAG